MEWDGILYCDGTHGVVLSGWLVVGVSAGGVSDGWSCGLGLRFHPSAKARPNELNLPAKETMSSIRNPSGLIELHGGLVPSCFGVSLIIFIITWV